jgi:hypothetical protein
LEKLKAGFGAAGLVALLGQDLFFKHFTARILDLELPVAERVGGIAVVAFSLAAFFIACIFSDVGDDGMKGSSLTAQRDNR